MNNFFYDNGIILPLNKYKLFVLDIRHNHRWSTNLVNEVVFLRFKHVFHDIYLRNDVIYYVYV